MPIDVSRLRELSPGPTINEVIEHPGRYPAAETQLRAMARRVVDDISRQVAPVLATTSMVQDALRAWQEEQQRWVSSLMAWQEAINAARSDIASLATPGLRAIDVLSRDAASATRSFEHVIREAVEAASQVRRIVDILFSRGTFWGDLHLARKGDIEALARLPSYVPWEPKHPDARRALAERGEVEGQAATRRQALMMGFYWAIQREEEPQRIRLGREFLQAEDGSLLLRPVELPIRFYFRWLRKEVINATEAYLLGEPYPMSEERRPLPMGDKELPLEEQELSVEELVLIQEAEEECRRQLETILARVTPRQRDILLVALETGPEWATVARRLALDPGAVRAQVTLLRRRLA